MLWAMRRRVAVGEEMTDDRGQMISNKNSSVSVNRLLSSAFCPLPSVLRPPSHQILLRDRGAEPVVVLDEMVDELVQAALKNFIDAEIFQARADHSRLALRRPLAAVCGGDPVEVLHQVLVAAGERARHLV